MQLEYPKLFEPLVAGKNIFRNRIFGGPHYAGVPLPGLNRHSMHVETLAEEARGGAAKVTIGDTMTDPVHGIQPWEDWTVDRVHSMFFGECAAAIKQYGAKAFIQLSHPGAYAIVKNPIAPMDIDFKDGTHVTGMTEDLMKHVIDHYAEAAMNAKTCGFDGVMIHGGHGWLLSQFLSPLTNQRTDEYGGSPENRGRFPARVVRAIREAVGPDFLVEYRISGCEYVPGGITPEMAATFLESVQDDLDLVNVSGGTEANPNMPFKPRTVLSVYQPRGYFVNDAAYIKSRLHIPVSAVGSINTPAQAEEILESGKADAVTMVRALIADPYLPEKTRRGCSGDIANCIRCYACLGESETKKTFACSVNPTFPRTYRTMYEYANRPEKRNVLVIGGGCAGLKAAATAADRGHSVTLVEKSGSLGGILKFTDHDDLKEELRDHKNYLIRQVEKRAVNVLLSTEITKENIASFNADAIIVATGSEKVVPPIEGIENAVHILDMYAGIDKVGKNVVIVGGGLSGVEGAVELARKGHKVTVLEAAKGFARDSNRMNSMGLMEACEELKDSASFIDEASVKAIGKDLVRYEKGGETVTLPADTVVYCTGMKSVNGLYLDICNAAPFVEMAGDCVRPRRTMEAIREGYFTALNIK